jgi:NAD(P)-dependent dehydrogenase (short-subunit alcohol dehydrogenase family)
MPSLSGKIALVTGASRGIGAATAQTLARAGAHVILTARTSAGLEEVEEAIHEAGGTATIAPLDLADGPGLRKLSEAVASRWPAVDIIVHAAAALGSLTPVPHLDEKEFAATVAVNLVATQRLIATFDPLLRRSEVGRIIALTTGVASQPRAYWGGYAATKAAMENLLLCYAAEVAAITPIRIALVSPGATRTRMRANAYPGEDPATVKPPEAVGEAIVALLERDFETGDRVQVGEPIGA